ncbi:hypothetical protein QJS66_14645 [Kocuria rhizophila]|nr:hypothetical protein QJS66_14645 [Kocuria rhizophila]
MFIILFGTGVRGRVDQARTRQPSTPAKFGIALLLIRCGVPGFITQADTASVLGWDRADSVATLGELFLSPVGLSLATSWHRGGSRLDGWPCTTSRRRWALHCPARWPSLDSRENEVAYSAPWARSPSSSVLSRRWPPSPSSG